MWFNKNRPPADLVTPRNDADEARASIEQTESGLVKVREQESFVQRISKVMIDRQGRNHYMELLYEHIPGSAS